MALLLGVPRGRVQRRSPAPGMRNARGVPRAPTTCAATVLKLALGAAQRGQGLSKVASVGLTDSPSVQKVIRTPSKDHNNNWVGVRAGRCAVDGTGGAAG
jgi:hypothetical protein